MKGLEQKECLGFSRSRLLCAASACAALLRLGRDMTNPSPDPVVLHILKPVIKIAKHFICSIFLRFRNHYVISFTRK